METSIYHDVVNHHFELSVDDQTAYMAYTERMGILTVEYTHLPAQLIGKGIFKMLADQILQFIIREGLKTIPMDIVFRNYLMGHPEYNNLLSEHCPHK